MDEAKAMRGLGRLFAARHFLPAACKISAAQRAFFRKRQAFLESRGRVACINRGRFAPAAQFG